MDQFHFDSALWNIYVKGRTDLFHINKVEDARDHLKFSLPPHRKTVYDFLFLTRGSSIRSKGLDKYNFGVNTFFFLPAYQISSHEYYSEDAEGYYCHFDLDILTRDLLLPDFSINFLFSNSLVIH